MEGSSSPLTGTQVQSVWKTGCRPICGSSCRTVFFALHHFTDKDHSIPDRQKTLSLGLSLSEWGRVPRRKRIPRGTVKSKLIPRKISSRLLASSTPALREGMGEVEAAERNELPELRIFRPQGLPNTAASDGRNTLDEMTAEADAKVGNTWALPIIPNQFSGQRLGRRTPGQASGGHSRAQ